MKFEVKDAVLEKLHNDIPSKQMEMCVIKNSIAALSDKAKELWCAERYDFTEDRDGVRAATKQITSTDIATAILAVAHLANVCDISEKEIQKIIDSEDVSDDDDEDEEDNGDCVSPMDIILMAMLAGFITKNRDTIEKHSNGNRNIVKEKFNKNTKENGDAKHN